MKKMEGYSLPLHHLFFWMFLKVLQFKKINCICLVHTHITMYIIYIVYSLQTYHQYDYHLQICDNSKLCEIPKLPDADSEVGPVKNKEVVCRFQKAI